MHLQILEVRKLLEEAQATYHKNTSAKALAYKELSQNDTEAATQIAARRGTQKELAESLSHWRSKALATAKEWGERNTSLATDRASEQLRHILQIWMTYRCTAE